MLQRRHFLQAGAAAALTPWAQMQALAQTSGPGYKALVCLFLFGGNDGNNLLVPIDARWADYQRARPNLAIAQDQLLALNFSNTGAARYGLHPAMAGLQGLINAGQASCIANIGPLVRPTTKADVQAQAVPLPLNLYSHSDQQGATQSAWADQPPRHGWGGRLLERSVAPGSPNRGYAAISVSGGNLWEASDAGLSPYRVSPGGRFGFDFYDPAGSDPLSSAITGLLTEQRANPFERTWLNIVNRSIENQRVLSAAVNGSTLATPFPGSGLGQQLLMVAKLINAQAALGQSRQCFFASLGGFDTHGDDQLQRQNELLGEISEAVAAFHAALLEMGRAEQVTLFSASDFGRNLPSNGAGTDHAWGSHHFVLGPGLPGGRLYGRFPDLRPDGPDDIGQGTWVPACSTEQLGSELARWFGADAATTAAVFPNGAYFPRLPGL